MPIERDQRIKLRRSTRKKISTSEEMPQNGEVVLIDSSGNGYDSLVIGDGKTKAKDLRIFPLNVSTGSIFLGSIGVTMDPGQPSQDSFYLASESGYYKHFGITVEPGEVAFLRWQYSGWSKLSVKIITVDNKLNRDSTNPVQNRVITRKFEELEGRIPKVDRDLSGESENAIMNCTVHDKIEEFEWYIDE